MAKIDFKKIVKEKLLQELDAIRLETKGDRREMSARMKELLKKEIDDYHKREKTRSAEMISIFSAHNFYANGFTPAELRTTLEDLGPTYVKIGQIMSSRVDLLPEAYCKELEKLRQNVKPLSAEVARAIIEEETGKTIDELYSEFRDEHLGSASIGQAHYAVLKDSTPVVTKVQRPLIADMMKKDYALLKKLAKLVNVVMDQDEDEQTIDLLSVIEELEKVTDEELDFRVEANNTKYFKENCIPDEEKITCPTVIDELTTSRIFTMTFVDGYTVSHKDRMIEDGFDVMQIGHNIAENFLYQVFDVGNFHADPHQGNIMVSKGKPYWIDFGMIGRIGSKEIDSVQKLVLSLLSGDVDDLVSGITSMGATSAKTDTDKLKDDAKAFIDKYTGVKGISDMDMSQLFDVVTELSAKHYIKLSGEFTMLARAVLALEGVIEQLCPDLDLFKLVSDKMIERRKKEFDLKQSLLGFGKNILSSGKKVSKLPVALTDTLSELSSGKLKVNVGLTGVEEPMEKLGVYVKYVVLTIVACVLFIGSCILAGNDITPKTPNGIPVISVAGIVFSIALTIYSIGKLTKKNRQGQVHLLRISNEYKKLKEAAACATVSFVCLLIYSFSCQSVTYLTDISSYHLNLVK